jgi:predicted ATPase
MAIEIDLSKLKTSWTKYDIVRVMEVIESLEILDKFKTKEASIDEPILKSFLGIKSLKDPLPEYWIKIQNYPNEKKLFAFFATLFTHGEVINDFAMDYSDGNMKGTFKIEGREKQYTNIRSALVESGAAQPIYRRTQEVPYDFSPIFQNPEVGKLFKQVLNERVTRLTKSLLTDTDFYEICYANNFHKAISVSKDQFKSWLEGSNLVESNFIEQVQIFNFFSVEEVHLDFKKAKEIYFLGENGDGKSLILMAIYLAFNGNYITEKTDQEKTGKASDIIRNNKDIQLFGIDNKGKEYNLKKGIYLNNFFAYGTHRGRYDTDKPEEYGFMSLFDSNQTLLNPVSWLKDQKLLEFEKTFDTDNNLGGDIKGFANSFSVVQLEKMFYDLLEKHVEIKVEGSGVLFKEKGTNLTFDQLSEGYKTILIFVSDLIFRLNKNAKEGQKITDLKGIILVDEIDLHLHPKWQRVIVGKLRILFPNIQFIFTTHSPTIIQGASEDAIMYRVYRNTQDGKTRVSDPYYRKDLDHLMINTLLTSSLFGLNDSRMNSDDINADTSDTYLLYRINKKLEEELVKQKAEGKEFIKDDEIDQLIETIINKELGKNDKN